MNHSLKDKLKVVQVLDPADVTADAKATGVDVADFNSLMFIVNAGETSGNDFSSSHKLAITVQHADVDTDGSYADCVDADIFDAEDGANGIAKNLDSTDDADAVHLVHYRGSKQFVRLHLVETGTVDVPISVTAIKGHSELQPPL